MAKSYETPASVMSLHFGQFIGHDLTQTSEQGLF